MKAVEFLKFESNRLSNVPLLDYLMKAVEELT